MASSGWRISLHGGHSGEFCEHAEGSLRSILEAACRANYAVFGVSEHMPRVEPRYLYATERQKGWTVHTLEQLFEQYALAVRQLAKEFEGRLTVLCGFEIEVVPPDRWVQLVERYRRDYGFDYIVGSVHFVRDGGIDSSVDDPDTRRALRECGGIENLALEYYQAVAEMVRAVRPEVVAHFDLVRLLAHRLGEAHLCETPRVSTAALHALEAVREAGSLLEVNTAGIRKGLGTPYPAAWIVQAAAQMGIPFCISDDSHRPSQVGFGLDAAREHLLQNGVREVHFLTRDHGAIVRAVAAL
ncbi:Histidinol-phosphatase [bacterium HR15]|nr:Histidinol-phosphatase [bacterium HR15]